MKFGLFLYSGLDGQENVSDNFFSSLGLSINRSISRNVESPIGELIINNHKIAKGGAFKTSIFAERDWKPTILGGAKESKDGFGEFIEILSKENHDDCIWICLKTNGFVHPNFFLNLEANRLVRIRNNDLFIPERMPIGQPDKLGPKQGKLKFTCMDGAIGRATCIKKLFSPANVNKSRSDELMLLKLFSKQGNNIRNIPGVIYFGHSSADLDLVRMQFGFIKETSVNIKRGH